MFNRKVYTTPKSYLDLVKCFQSMIKEKKEETEGNILKLTNGLTKLVESGKDVKELEEKLKEMEPILIIKNKDQEQLIKLLEKKQEDANM